MGRRIENHARDRFCHHTIATEGPRWLTAGERKPFFSFTIGNQFMPRFKTRPTFVRAMQWFKPGDHEKVSRCLIDGFNIWRDVVIVCGHKISVFPSDWILEDESGQMLGPCNQETFDSLYEPAE